MDRRRLLPTSIAAAIAIPFGTEPQAIGRSERIGLVASGFASQHVAGGSLAHQDAALEDGLRDVGYIPGQNVTIDYRYAEGDSARIPHLADELIQQGVEALVAAGPAAVTAARKATTSTPIVAIDLETDP